MPELIRFQLLLATFAGWVNREQAEAIEAVIAKLRDPERAAQNARPETSER